MSDNVKLKELRELIKKDILSIEERTRKNKLLKYKEDMERKYIESGKYSYDFIYPSLYDPQFSSKIARKAEFYDNRYEYNTNSVLEEEGEKCFAPFEISPHQQFIRNFLSKDTPYNGLLLFHGLGTGKTCSAISVAENFRRDNRGVAKIIVIASPNIQDNFKLQLFDERKLKKKNGIWNLSACTGNSILREINPMNNPELTKGSIMKQVKQIIRENYVFMGYTQFANYIDRIKSRFRREDYSKSKQIRLIRKRLQQEFSNRLIIVDEVHNIRVSGENSKKRIGKNLLSVIRHSKNMKLLLMSATPLFNDYTEIIHLTNLLNINDGRSVIRLKDVFDNKGLFKVDKETGELVGQKLLMEKLTGYVSYLQGEDPYTFPYRIYPKMFNVERSSLNEAIVLPRLDPYGKIINKPLQHMDLYMTQLGNYQLNAYNYILNEMEEPDVHGDIETKLGWQKLDLPLQSLNIVYPNDDFMNYFGIEEGAVAERKESQDDEMRDVVMPETNELVGIRGLNSTMNYDKKTRSNFEYKDGVLDKYGRFFHMDYLQEYSGKIYSLMNAILNSSGIVLIYTQYIGGGAIPIALALEELGITRYGRTKNLLKKKRSKPLNAYTMRPREGDEEYKPAKYTIISGDKKISPNNKLEVNASTNDSNKDGSDVKVVIITRAGSEGIDFKNIRQVHILEPWYNNSRNEQTIGRGVRYCSHKLLPFKERNVEIYMYGSNSYGDIEDQREMVDMFVYRKAEQKSILVGNVTRVMKEIAVDCQLNEPKNNLTVGKLNEVVEQRLSSNKVIDYPIGLKPFSAICDYKERCEYKCIPGVIEDPGEDKSTYSKDYIVLNIDRIIDEIKRLFRVRFVYKKDELLKLINKKRNYPIEQVYIALDYLLNNDSEVILDIYDRSGIIMNVGDYYYYQPNEFKKQHNSTYDRKIPVEYKRDFLKIELDTILDEVTKDKTLGVPGEAIFLDIVKKFSEEKVMLQPLIEQLNSFNNLISVEIPEINQETLELLLVENLIDSLGVNNKKELLRYIINSSEELAQKKYEPLTAGGAAAGEDVVDEPAADIRDDSNRYLRTIITNYLFKTIIISDDRGDNYVILMDKQGRNLLTNIYTINEAGDYVTATRSSIKRLTPVIKSKFTINKDKLAGNIGFYSIFKNIDNVIFKIKNPDKIGEKGWNCMQGKKDKIMNVLYSLSNSYGDKDKQIEITNILQRSSDRKSINKKTICLFTEYLLRYLQHIYYDGKIWYIPPEIATLNHLEKK